MLLLRGFYGRLEKIFNRFKRGSNESTDTNTVERSTVSKRSMDSRGTEIKIPDPWDKKMNYEKVKLIAHNLKLLAQSLEDAIKEDPDKYLRKDGKHPNGYYSENFDDDDGYCD